MALLLLMVLLQILCSMNESKALKAFVTPSSYTASLESTVNFKCVVTAGAVLVWYVDDVQSDDIHIKNRQIMTTQVINHNSTFIESDIIVPATDRNNGTELFCAAIIFPSQSAISKKAVLSVQGLLAAPVNLTVGISHGGLLILQWGPPFTLDITDRDPDITTYSVYHNISITTTAVNTTITEYIVLELNPTASITFRITAWNAVGEGNYTEIIYRPPTAYIITEVEMEEVELSPITAIIVFGESEQPTLYLSFKILNYSCCLQVSLSFDVLTMTMDLQLVQDYSLSASEVSHNGTITLSLSDLPLNKHMIALITNKNITTTTATQNITFSTYDVQSANITQGDIPGSVCITCYFAQGSQAQGCHALVSQNGSMEIFSHDIRRSNASKVQSTCINGLKGKGTYKITIFDLESNGTVDVNNPVLRVVFTFALEVSLPLLVRTQSDVTVHVPHTPIPIQSGGGDPVHEGTVITVAVGVGIGVGGSLVLILGGLVVLCICVGVMKSRNATKAQDQIEMGDNRAYEMVIRSKVSSGRIPTQDNDAYGLVGSQHRRPTTQHTFM